MPTTPAPAAVRRPLLAWLGAVVAALVGLVVSLRVTGAADAPLLADPGAIVRWALPVVTVTVHVAATITAGCFTVAAVVLPLPRKAHVPHVSARERMALAATAPRSRASAADTSDHAGTTRPTGPDAAPRPPWKGTTARPAVKGTTAGPDTPAAAPRPGGEGATARPRPTNPRREARPPTRAWTAVVRTGTIAAMIWGPAAAALVILTHLSVVGEPLAPEIYPASLWQFITELELGITLVWGAALAMLVGIVAAATVTGTGAVWAAALSMIALLPTAFTGHAAGAANHEMAVSGMWLHIGGVVLWAGGLAGVLVAGRHLSRAGLSTAAERYSSIAAWAAVLVAVSGVASAWLRLTGLGDLVTTGWGQLVLVKTVGTGALLAAGWWHRVRTLPLLREGRAGAFERLALGEVVVMAAVIGVAVALGSSETPVPIAPPPDASPTYLQTNNPVPPYPTFLTYLTVWRPDPLWVLITVAGMLVYGRWVARLRRRGDRWPVGRTISWMVGMLLFGYLTCGAPTVYGDILFSAHMVMHMALVMLVPIFVVLAAPITLALRALPVRTDGSRGPREWLLALTHSRYAAFWANPVVAGVNFSGSLVVFYFTPLFTLALGTHLGHLLMVVHFGLAGYMFAAVLIGVDPGMKRPAYPFRLVMLIATMAFHAFFGIAVIQSTTLLAADHFGWLGLPWGVDAMADQEIGGAITWGIGELPTLALAIGVAFRWSRSERKEARRLDRRADADDDAELRAYNAMLAERAARSAAQRTRR